MAAPSELPALHSLNIAKDLGRGEVIRLFLTDAGIEFEDIRYPHDDTWPATSKELKKRGISRTCKLPVLEYAGIVLSQHLAILRYLARGLGRYDGETSLEKHLVDAVADIYGDWKVSQGVISHHLQGAWSAQIEQRTDEYTNETAPNYYDIIAQYYSDFAGPYLLGSKITYADFAVYQSIDNGQQTGTLPSTLPESLTRFIEAFEARPRIAAYLASRRETPPVL